MTTQGMTYGKAYHLIQKFHRPENIYNAAPEEYSGIKLISEETIDNLKDKSFKRAEACANDCERREIRIVTVDDADYPDRLRNIDANPYVLYLAGREADEVDLDHSLTVGIIGSRKATPYGIECATKLSMDLTDAGALVISGMAEGIDGAANLGALKAGGMTVAVLGCGLNIAYPAIHKELMLHIKKRGLLISEYPPGSRPLQFHFPERNRIISGLSEAILIVEAKKKSGSKITGDLALEQGKDVFVVPGSIFSPNSEGTLSYLKEGAKPVTCAEDIMSEYRFKYHLEEVKKPDYENAPKIEDNNSDIVHIINTDEKYKDLGESDKNILKCMSYEPESFDKICSNLEIPANELNGKLAILAIKGFVKQYPYSRYSLI